MYSAQLQTAEYYTADHLAALARVSPQAVNKRLRNSNFSLGFIQTDGRPTRIYRKEALRLWQPEQTQTQSARKLRNDKGKTRTRNEQCVEWLVALAFAEYMSNAIKDVRSACRRAIVHAVHLVESGNATQFTIDDIRVCAENEWLYKKHVARSDKYFKGPVYTDGWQQKHTLKWHKHTDALTTGHVKYNFWKLAENELGCTQGRGFARFIMLDDRKGDAWALDKETGATKMRYGVYAWCVLTGALLWVEQCETVTAQTYVRAIVNTIYAHGLDCPVFFMENSRAAIADQVEGVVKSLYTDSDRQVLASEQYKMLFRSESGIVRNCPHIPRDLGKAKGERLFAEIKRSDSLNFPQSFHGAGLHEAVQLERKQMPILGAYTPNAAEYFDTLYNYAYSEHLNVQRDSLKEWAITHKSEPTYTAMMQYYMPETKVYPSPVQLANLLYYSMPIHQVQLTEAGSLRVTMNNRKLNLRAQELYDYSLLKAKLHVCAIPNDDRYLVFIPSTKTELPQLVCIAEDYTVTQAEDIRFRQQSRQLREGYRAKREAETEATYAKAGVSADELIKSRTLAPKQVTAPETIISLPMDEQYVIDATVYDEPITEDTSNDDEFKLDIDLF